MGSAKANLTGTDQPGERRRFVEFWHGLRGHDPPWLAFDSQVVPSPELSRVNQRGIHFVTLRRRGAAVIRRRRHLPPPAGQRAVINPPQRCHPPVRFVDETIRLPGSDGTIRPWAVAGLGREPPPLFLSPNVTEPARRLILR